MAIRNARQFRFRLFSVFCVKSVNGHKCNVILIHYTSLIMMHQKQEMRVKSQSIPLSCTSNYFP